MKIASLNHSSKISQSPEAETLRGGRRVALKFLYSIVVLFGICFLIFFRSFTKEKNTNNWNETIATVIKIAYGRSGGAVKEYEVNGKLYYIKTGEGPWGGSVGDKYIVKYNPENPKEYVIEYESVLFLPDEDVTEVIGEVSLLQWNGFKRSSIHDFEFKYYVGGRKFKRNQFLPDNWLKSYPNFDKGNKYLVKYFNRNPQRAVIYLSEQR